jgi:hypothetical protein
MAGLEINFPDNLLSNLLNASFEDIAKEALTEVTPIMVESIKDSIRAAERGAGTGELVDSIKGVKPKRTKTDAWVVNVGPSGKSNNNYYYGKSHKRQYPVSNALKAIWLNYGNAHQAPSPWLTPAINNSQAEILRRMQKKWEEMTR